MVGASNHVFRVAVKVILSLIVTITVLIFWIVFLKGSKGEIESDVKLEPEIRLVIEDNKVKTLYVYKLNK